MTYNPRRGPSETYSATCFRNLEPTRGVCVRADHRLPTRSRSLAVTKSGCTVDLAAIAAPHDLRFTRPPLRTQIVGGITVFNGSRYRMGFKDEHRTGVALADFHASKDSAANFLRQSGNLIIRQETTADNPGFSQPSRNIPTEWKNEIPSKKLRDLARTETQSPSDSVSTCTQCRTVVQDAK